MWSLLFRILLLVTESPGPAGIINIMIGLIGLGEFVHVKVLGKPVERITVMPFFFSFREHLFFELLEALG